MKFFSLILKVLFISSKFKKIFLSLVNKIKIENGIKNTQLIIIITANVIKDTQRNSPSTIKYPRLIIIGEITNIIELIRNNICCKNKLFLELTSKMDIISPIKVTIVAVKKLKIKEFIKASIKYFFKK